MPGCPLPAGERASGGLMTGHQFFLSAFVRFVVPIGTMKALIPAAGLGTRYLPLTKAVPKELIPVGAFPVLHHVVAEAKSAGCTEIGIILSEGKEAIRRYFTWDAELMSWLDDKGKREAMADWEALMEGLSFTWILQDEQRGLGHAIGCGAEFVGEDACCVLLGDTLMEGGSPLPGMVALYSDTGRSVVAVEDVPPERATRYGVCWGKARPDGTFDLERMVEKPSLEVMEAQKGSPPMAFAARYILTAGIFEELAKGRTGHNGEIQLTDAMSELMAREGFHACRLPGKRRDIGSPD